MIWLWAIVVWFAISIPVSILLGKIIALGDRPHKKLGNETEFEALCYPPFDGKPGSIDRLNSTGPLSATGSSIIIPFDSTDDESAADRRGY